MTEFEVRPPLSDEERVALERVLREIVAEAATAEPRASSAWWRAGVRDGFDPVDPSEAAPSGPES